MSFTYKLFFLLHLTAVIVGFGSSFVYPFLAARSKGLPAREAYAVNHLGFGASKYLTTIPIYLAGAFGIVLVLVSEQSWKFSQTWVSVAFLLFIVAALVAGFLHNPNLKAIDLLQEKMAAAESGGPAPTAKESAELDQRMGKAGMFGGILHLLFLLLMIDMIWKPGLGL